MPQPFSLSLLQHKWRARPSTVRVHALLFCSPPLFLSNEFLTFWLRLKKKIRRVQLKMRRRNQIVQWRVSSDQGLLVFRNMKCFSEKSFNFVPRLSQEKFDQQLTRSLYCLAWCSFSKKEDLLVYTLTSINVCNVHFPIFFQLIADDSKSYWKFLRLLTACDFKMMIYRG